MYPPPPPPPPKEEQEMGFGWEIEACLGEDV